MQILQGTIHSIPEDLLNLLNKNDSILSLWNNLTPLARNEWICWLTIVKKEETRNKHLARLESDILSGKKRPCCWPGCPHNNKNAEKYFNKK